MPGGYPAVFGGTAATVLSTVDTLDLSSCTAVTIEFFAKVKDSAERVYFLEHTESMNANRGGFHVNLNERDVGEHRIGALMKTTDEELGIACVDTLPGPLQDGAWHHVAIVLRCNRTRVYDAQNPGAWCVAVWLDGKVVERAGHRIARLSETSAACRFRNARLYLGSRANDNGFLTGEMDDIRISSGVVSPEEFLKKRTQTPQTVIRVQ